MELTICNVDLLITRELRAIFMEVQNLKSLVAKINPIAKRMEERIVVEGLDRKTLGENRADAVSYN